MTKSNSVNREDLLTTLLSSHLTNNMHDSDISALVEIAEEQIYENGKVIIHEDARTRDLYIVHRGKASVKITLPSEVGHQEFVYAMRDGQIFGELSLLDGSPRSATVVAETEVITFRFDYDQLMNLLDEQPRIGYHLMRNLAIIISARMRNTNMLWRNSMMW